MAVKLCSTEWQATVFEVNEAEREIGEDVAVAARDDRFA